MIAIALNDFAPIAAAGGPSALPNDDGPSGIRADGTIAFPSAQTLASTFDRSLARQYGDAIATEARARASTGASARDGHRPYAARRTAAGEPRARTRSSRARPSRRRSPPRRRAA
jgi:hypothetical protein